MKRAHLDPRIEVRGDIALILLETLGAFRGIAREILTERGIADPQPHHWYPLRGFLECLDAIAERVGPNTVTQIGRQIPGKGFYPPGIDVLDEVLLNLDAAYRSCHRGGDVGGYDFSFTGLSSGRMTCRSPYPCNFDRGLLESLAHRFEPAGSFVHVRHDDRGPCRERGDSSCNFAIDW